MNSNTYMAAFATMSLEACEVETAGSTNTAYKIIFRNSIGRLSVRYDKTRLHLVFEDKYLKTTLLNHLGWERLTINNGSVSYLSRAVLAGTLAATVHEAITAMNEAEAHELGKPVGESSMKVTAETIEALSEKFNEMLRDYCTSLGLPNVQVAEASVSGKSSTFATLTGHVVDTNTGGGINVSALVFGGQDRVLSIAVSPIAVAVAEYVHTSGTPTTCKVTQPATVLCSDKLAEELKQRYSQEHFLTLIKEYVEKKAERKEEVRTRFLMQQQWVDLHRNQGKMIGSQLEVPLSKGLSLLFRQSNNGDITAGFVGTPKMTYKATKILLGKAFKMGSVPELE